MKNEREEGEAGLREVEILGRFEMGKFGRYLN